MLEDFFLKSRWIDGIRSGPLGHHVDAFCDDLVAQGYTRCSVRQAVSAVGRFGRWLDNRKLGARDVSEDIIARFRARRTHRRYLTGEAMLHRLLLRLRRNGVAPEPALRTERTPLEQIEESFCGYMRHERALSPATIQNYALVARRFVLHRFGAGSIDLTALNVQDVRAFILAGTPGLSAKMMRTTLTAIRSFLRFLYLRGDIHSRLADYVIRSPRCRNDPPPPSLTPDEIALVLDRCDRQSATGRRDYAILMMLARLGLRAGEIASLKLDDIRWETGDIVVCGKARQKKRFPLLQEVGEAIASYLKDGRPHCRSRHVFVRAKAPRREVAGSSAIYFIVAGAIARAGLHPSRKGPHLFRHSLATNMLREGATLQEIGHILHHRDQNTTAIYAKVDIDGLRDIALPWPEDKP